MSIPLQNPAEVCGGVFGAVTHFLLEYTSSSGTICSSRQLPAGCDGGVCVDVFNVTSDCRGVSYNTSVRAGNIVGLGAASATMFESNSGIKFCILNRFLSVNRFLNTICLQFVTI